ncbi:MAG: hypothetical protein AAF518_23865, partial [Spirochaetota bacterium]
VFFFKKCFFWYLMSERYISMYARNFIQIFFLFLLIACRTPTKVSGNANETEPAMRTVKSFSQSHQDLDGQISCPEKKCVRVNYQEYEELDGKINDLMSKGAGKIFIQMKYYNKRLNDEELEDVLAYMREISKRQGRVSVEPYYIRQRSLADLKIPVIKDFALRFWDIYSRIRNSIKYRHTENYNAKILYHPRYYNVMMVFFIHKNYGDVCDTVYSTCKIVEYIDDETFDQTLSKALEDATSKKYPVKVVFNQDVANLPDTKINLETLKKLNHSSRLYKWLIVTKETEKKSIKKERFLTAELVVNLIDYSITAYDWVKQYLLYRPAFQTKAEVTYSGQERGGKIVSVVFTPLAEGN